MLPSTKPIVVSLLVCLAASACGDDGDGGGVFDASATPDARGAIDAALVDGGPSGPDARSDANTVPADAALPGEVVINEVVLDETGNDNDEFAELKGLPNTDYSGLTMLQIDGDDDNDVSLNPGIVISAHAGCTTDANGHCEIMVNNNTFQNGSQTILLVSGATVTVGTTDIDGDNDGVIDNEPWTALLDGMAIVNSATDFGYAGNTLLMKTVAGGGEPTTFGGASRIPDGTDTDASADWVSNTPNFDNSGIVSGEARNTPAAANTVEP